MFKLEGYGATSSWSGGSKTLPFSAMAAANYVRTAKALSEPPADHFSTNDNSVVQEVSLFIAGRITQGLGMFAQVTHSGVERETSLDNVDIRYAREFKLAGKDSVAGVSLNNNPTVQDLWNTTPAWSFPYISPDLAPGRPAAPLISDGLGGQVIGATGYLWFDDKVYLEAGGYRAASDNLLNTFNLSQDTVIAGTAPYARLAFSSSHHGQTLSAGAFVLDAKVRPDPADPATDRYLDLGLDATYQKLLPKKAVFSVNGSLIHEARTFDASFAAGDVGRRKGDLNSLNLDASYYWDRKYGATVGLFRTWGSRDDILFSPEADVGSRNGRPDTSGVMFQADWTPFGREGSWAAPNANLRVGVQYTAYGQFAGSGSNYDGFGRSASDNNTLSLFVWTAF